MYTEAGYKWLWSMWSKSIKIKTRIYQKTLSRKVKFNEKISVYSIPKRSFFAYYRAGEDDSNGCAWETSVLRTWLNQNFYQNALNQKG